MNDFITDLISTFTFCRTSHDSVSRSCRDIYDLNGEYYHSGIAAGYESVILYLEHLLSELDSESGR